jgi:predicted transcriptional regulator
VDLIDTSNPTCDNVQVVVDGIKIPDGPEYLLRTPASEIESMEFVSPVQAQILYGTGGDTSNGVVVVYSRGRGPYASPLRNRRN